jgi:predicted TPR repeat methyltransferase
MTTDAPALDETIARAVDHRRAGRLAEAEALYLGVLAQQPHHPGVNHALGLIALNRGRVELAAERLAKAVAAAPERARFHNSLGAAYRALGLVEEALSAFERAVALDPGDAFAHTNQGLALHALRRPGAEAAFRRALEIRPDSATARGGLGVTLSREGRHDEAIEALQAALANLPADLELRLDLARAYVAAGRNDAAAAVAEQMRPFEDAPGFPTLRLCVVLAQAGRPELAAPFLHRSLERDPADAAGAGPMLARLAAAAPPPRASDAQMQGVYAVKAKSWDRTETYFAARMVAEAVEQRLVANGSVLDLGCGTGLVGEALRPRAGRLTGVDLSPHMLARAQAKGVYDELHEAEILAFLGAFEARYDAVACAATLIHFGRLDAAFSAVARRLATGGTFALTVFPFPDPHGFGLHPKLTFAQNGIYAHGAAYVAATAAACGLSVLVLADAVHEVGADGEAVGGLLVVLGR